MRILMCAVLLSFGLADYANANVLDVETWGSKSQGWKDLTEFELSPDSVVVELSEFAIWLNNAESLPLLREIARMGPRPAPSGDRKKDLSPEGNQGWNSRLEKDVLHTKLGNSFWDEMTRPAGAPPNATADDWYGAFLGMRRLRLYEASGYHVIGMQSVLYSDVGRMHLFLLVKD